MLGMSCLWSEASSRIAEPIMSLSFGIMSIYRLCNYKNRLYIHGGLDLKDGFFGDIWKLNLNFMKDPDVLKDGYDIEYEHWQELTVTGTYPKKIAHHKGVLQESLKQYVIYGGIIGLDSSDILYVIDLNSLNFEAIPSSL
jgi:hypothetical protein